ECTLRPQRRETLRPARGVPAIDDSAERKEDGVLCECQGHRGRAAPPRLRIRDSEHRAVRRVHGQARERPGSRTGHRLAEHGNVRVIVAQHPLVERLDCGPHERSNRACLRGVHAATLPASRPRHPRSATTGFRGHSGTLAQPSVLYRPAFLSAPDDLEGPAPNLSLALLADRLYVTLAM